MWLCWLEAAEAEEAELREPTPRFARAAAAAGLARYPSGSFQQMNMLHRARLLWELAALQVPQLPPQTAELVGLVVLATFD